VDRTNDKSLRQLRSKQLNERAIFFKRLAVGAADPKFASKLQGLVDEYESAAARIILEADSAALQGDRTQTQGKPAYRVD
jgi:hypothetical protein